jgi:hypothetical protein
MDEIAGQAYAHFVQTERGLGMTANLTVNYSAPLPTCKDLLVVAGVEKVDGRKVTIHVEVRDGPPNECVLGDGKDDDVSDDEVCETDGEVFAQGSALFIVLAKD